MGVDDGVANGASNVPLVGVGDVLALLHGLGDTVGVANLVQKSPHAHPFEMLDAFEVNIGFFLQLPDRLDGLGDAGVVEGGVGAAVEGLGISLPLAKMAVA